MLDGLFVTPSVTVVAEALTSAQATGRIAVVGNARLAAGLAAAHHDVVAVGVSKRAARRLASVVDALSALEARSLAGVVGTGLAAADDWERALAAWSHAVHDGGAIVMVDRGGAPEASRRALCGGLGELEQRRAGRIVVTSGLVTHL